MHVSKDDVQDLQQGYRPTTSKTPAVYVIVHMEVLYIPVFHQTHLECLQLKRLMF